MLIRDEATADQASITRVIEAAFATTRHAGGNEARIVQALRDRNELTVSLVAEHEGRLVGHVALSPVTLDDGTPRWLGLGPISVAPEQQQRGIGTALIRAALARLQALGANGCVVLGEPAYYTRFGFRQQTALQLADVPPDYFLALPLAGTLPGTNVAYSPAFYVA